jgi:hypothetical protein
VLTILAIGLGLFGSCVSGNGRNDQIVDGLRILGVRSEVKGDADLADADIGDTVILSALVVPPKDVAAVTVTWLACLRADAQTAVPCTDQGVLRDPLSLIGMSGVLTLGTGVNVEAIIPEEARSLVEAVLARADTQTAAECALFVETPLIVVAQASDGTVVTASKTLRLSPYHTLRASSDPMYHYLPNTNPAIDALVLNPTGRDACGGPSAVVACAQDSDCAGTGCVNGACVFPDGNQIVCGHIPDTGELVARCGLDGVVESKPEQLSVSWYATGGSVGGIASATGTAADLASQTFLSFTRPSGPFTLWGVARDGRAGEAWIAQDFQ